ncbi:PTS cellobiose transporter subunit IIB [Aerococcus urinaeequi]|uniref:PTS cellobiose transporter subunit IIB n=1 Tax=Aerococcus urinaeequi TaxID=51665 RepID=A0AA47GAR8_9LACT|nr:PTS cellobiose transporter subunit IIB [Aerococcus urinaeequi]MDT2762232.1 PTS cellobiose transporter subunit IIB [Aerococcus urinaeequi]WAT24419.1 PTS cellobiose transporter subunit IIB [Aerococcus urinaeequi]
MKKALIVCAGGMSSSMIAKKVTDLFQSEGKGIELDATSVSAGPKAIEEDKFDLYLVSPQTKMNFESLSKLAAKKNKPIVNIPPQAYVPIPRSTQMLAELVEDNI